MFHSPDTLPPHFLAVMLLYSRAKIWNLPYFFRWHTIFSLLDSQVILVAVMSGSIGW